MDTLLIFARWPEPGRVKTRLSPALPPALACALHRAMLDDALWAALACGAERRVVAWADAPASSVADLPGGFARLDQRGADLGERLAAAFVPALEAPADRAVAIGADCPEIAGADLDTAFAALGRHDLVIGPSRDGGYWLIGLARSVPGLFEGVAWGTGAAAARTLANAAAAGLRVARLGARADVDTPADLARLIGALAVRRDARARFTRATLAAMGLLPGP